MPHCHHTVIWGWVTSAVCGVNIPGMWPILEELVVFGAEEATMTAGMSSGGLMKPALLGATGGIMAESDRQALLFGALGGVAGSFLGRGRHDAPSLAISVVTSTALGLVAYRMKEGFLHREEQRKYTLPQNNQR